MTDEEQRFQDVLADIRAVNEAQYEERFAEARQQSIRELAENELELERLITRAVKQALIEAGITNLRGKYHE